MAAIDIGKARQRIIAERDRLLADRQRLGLQEEGGMSGQVGELTDFDLNHPGDSGSEMFQREKDMALNENIDGMLAQIEEALAKIDAGTYSKCDRCGRPIAPARLEAIPYATLCIDCQSRVENQ